MKLIFDSQSDFSCFLFFSPGENRDKKAYIHIWTLITVMVPLFSFIAKHAKLARHKLQTCSSYYCDAIVSLVEQLRKEEVSEEPMDRPTDRRL